MLHDPERELRAGPAASLSIAFALPALMAKAGRGSYATYLLHPVVLVSVMLAFRVVPLGAGLKFVLVSVVAVPVCFAVGYVVTRLPGVGRVV